MMILLQAATFPGGTAGDLAKFLSRRASDAPVVLVTEKVDGLRSAKVEATDVAGLKREIAPFFGLIVRKGEPFGLGPLDMPVSAFPGLPKPGEQPNVGAARQTRPNRPVRGGRPPRRSDDSAYERTMNTAPLPAEPAITYASLSGTDKGFSVEGGTVRGTELRKLGTTPDWMVSNIAVAVSAKNADPKALRAAWAEALGATEDGGTMRFDPKTLPNRALNTWRAAARKAGGVGGALVLAAADMIRSMPEKDIVEFFSSATNQEEMSTRPGTPAHAAFLQALVAGGAANYPTPAGPLGPLVNPRGPARIRIRADGTVTATLSSTQGPPIELRAMRPRFLDAVAGLDLRPRPAIDFTGSEVIR